MNHLSYILAELKNLETNKQLRLKDKQLVLQYGLGVLFIRFSPLWKAAVNCVVEVLEGEANIDKQNALWAIFFIAFSRCCGYEKEENITKLLVDKAKQTEQEDSEESDVVEHKSSTLDKEDTRDTEEMDLEESEEIEVEDTASKLVTLCDTFNLYADTINCTAYREHVWLIAARSGRISERYSKTIIPKFFDILDVWNRRVHVESSNMYVLLKSLLTC